MSTAVYESAPRGRSARVTPVQRLWRRELEHYPAERQRYAMLSLVVLATITLYYENYINGAVATQILRDLHMSFGYFVMVLVIANGIGAFASLAAGLSDRAGRANLVAYGLLITGGLTLFGFPNVQSKLGFGILSACLGFVEGIVLVATPALVRDFSPQLGRASAMGFWTVGPVAGSLVVSEVSSHTLKHLTRWQDQFIICGIVGLVVWAVTLLFLRELAPRIRDQLMVSLQDRALVEAKAKGIDLEAAMARPWSRVLKPSIISSAVAIGLFLLSYYTAVAFFPIFFQTVQGFTADQANGLLNYYWSANVVSLIVAGVLSDKLRVRKPFMLIGGIGAIVFLALIYAQTPHTDTSYRAWSLIMAGVGVYAGIAFATWMASFTETVEEISPALIAHGLAVWGWILRAIVAVAFLLLPHVISSVTPLVENGPAVQAAATREAKYLPTVQANQEFLNNVAKQYPDGNLPDAAATIVVETVGADVATRLTTPEGKADFALLAKDGPKVLAAQAKSPDQWRHWFLICLLGQIVFLPLIFVLGGPWSSRRAREEAEAHERLVREEMARLHISQPA